MESNIDAKRGQEYSARMSLELVRDDFLGRRDQIRNERVKAEQVISDLKSKVEKYGKCPRRLMLEVRLAGEQSSQLGRALLVGEAGVIVELPDHKKRSLSVNDLAGAKFYRFTNQSLF